MDFYVQLDCFFSPFYTMSHLDVIDIIGYTAAVVTNISIFPQAYNVSIIVSRGELNKLNAISPCMFILQFSGCALWFLYAFLMNLFPIMAGSVITMVPSSYILVMVFCYKPSSNLVEIEENEQEDKNAPVEVIVSTSSIYNEHHTSSES